VTQHASLTAERWSSFGRDQQILMIAYERVLRLADLTVEVQGSRSLRRELLRWRELAGGVYLEPDESRHRALFRALLLLTPASAKQLPYLLPDSGAASSG